MFVIAVLACGTQTPEASAEDSASSPAVSTVAREDLDAWVPRLEGTWVGTAETPMGTMPFAMNGEELDGGVRLAIDQGGLSIALHFRPTATGWRLTERGELPGGFVQEHDLVPVAVDGNETTWVSEEPGLMDLVTSVDDGHWSLAVSVRGTPHAAWTLERL